MSAEQSVLERIAASLPNEWTAENDQAEILLSYEAASNIWELEYCALDPKRNFTLSADTLDELLPEALESAERTYS